MLLFPVSDDNDEGYASHAKDFVHWGLIFCCLVAFGIEIYQAVAYGMEGVGAFIERWSFDPRILGDNYLRMGFADRAVKLGKYLMHIDNMALVQILASTFLHGGLAHLFGNLLVLYMLGDNVEYAMGHLRYLLFFLFAGIASECGEIIFTTYSNFKGGIGASGAIMAVAGAYMFYFPKAKINFFYMILVFWWGIFALPARLVIGVYFLAQVAEAIHDYGTDYDNVAVWAHVTGFALGLLLAWPLRKNRNEPLYQPRARAAYNRSLRGRLRHDPWGNDPRR
jgi:membrane associated rhomboid family serine protease